MWTLSGFVDEISPDFTEQCRVAAGLGLTYVELRSAWDVNILDLDPEQLGRHEGDAGGARPRGVQHRLADRQDLHRRGRSRRTSSACGTPRRWRTSSTRRTCGSSRSSCARTPNPADHRDEVIDRMRALARVAEDADLVLLHENEKEIYGDVPSRCLDIVRSVGSPHLRLAWDPANFVQVGVRPYTDGYAVLRPHLEYMQIKDALAADGTVVPAGERRRRGGPHHPRAAPRRLRRVLLARTAPAHRDRRQAGSPARTCSAPRGRPSPTMLKTEGIEYA